VRGKGLRLMEILLRVMVGGVVVSAFARLGDLLKPKTFAGPHLRSRSASPGWSFLGGIQESLYSTPWQYHASFKGLC
jgi:hypothetical protein